MLILNKLNNEFIFIFCQFNMFEIIRISYHLTLTQSIKFVHYISVYCKCHALTIIPQAIHMEKFKSKVVSRQVISVDIIIWTIIKFLSFYKQAALLNVILLCSSSSLHVKFLSRITFSAVVRYSMFMCQCLITLYNYIYQNRGVRMSVWSF